MGKRLLLALTLASLYVAMTVSSPSVILSQGATITVSNSVSGVTLKYIGATEGGYFNVSDLTDCGINTYRVWIGMSDVEYCDDNDPRGYNWGCDQAGNTHFGLPITNTIKADPNIINWGDWDVHINDPDYRWRTDIRHMAADCAHRF